MSTSTKKGSGSGSGGGNKKPSGGQGSGTGKSSSSGQSSTKGKGKADDRAPSEGRRPPGGPRPSVYERRTVSPGSSHSSTPPRASTPVPPSLSMLSGMGQQMELAMNPKRRQEWQEEQATMSRAVGAGQSVEASGRIDLTNRTDELRPPALPVDRQFAPLRNARRLSHHYPGPTVYPRPSNEKTLWGNNENYVLVTEYLTHQQYEDGPVKQLPARHCAYVLSKCFGTNEKQYDERTVGLQLQQMQQTGFIPGDHVMRPGEWNYGVLKRLAEVWARCKANTNISDGDRLTAMFEAHPEGVSGYPAFHPDGGVIPVKVDQGLDLLRSIKYLDAWLANYGWDHWPKAVQDKAWYLFQRKAQDGTRDNADWEILAYLGKDEAETRAIKARYCMFSDNAIGAYLWVTLREKMPEDKKVAMEQTKYYFSTSPNPSAGRYTEGSG